MIHPDFPLSVKTEIEPALSTELTRVERPRSGTWTHTYLIGDREHQWVARVYEAPGRRLKKSFVVQQKAASVGMRVPKIVAHRLEAPEPGGHIWTVEEFVRGDEFFPEHFDRETRMSISVDSGRQLRRLHAVEVDGFGFFRKDALHAQYATWGEWLDAQEKGIEEAVEIAGLRGDDVPVIKAAYDALRDAYPDSARLCHGDFAGDNLLVEDGRLVAVVDWENALACDPAHDVAYWCRWHEDLECLDALLAGYDPAAPEGFRRRVLAHHVLLAVDFIVWYEEEGDREGVEDCRRMLREIVQNPHRD